MSCEEAHECVCGHKRRDHDGDQTCIPCQIEPSQCWDFECRECAEEDGK